MTEPAPPAPAPDPAPDPPPPAAVQPKPKAKPKAVQRPASPSVSRTPSQPRSTVAPTPSPPSVRRPARPAPKPKPVVRAKPKPKKKRPAQNAPTVGAVAGTTAALPPGEEEELPSELAAPAIETPSSDGGGAPVSILMTSLIALALALAALASIPTRQLALLPATRWVVKRRLDLVIGGMGALAALLGVLFISAVFGP